VIRDRAWAPRNPERQCDVTAHPTAVWVIQQLRETFPDDTSIRYLIHDNDSIFSDRVDEWISSLGIEPRRTAFRSPWQNGTAEHWVGTVKRELLDHVIILDEHHLGRMLREYAEYYNTDRVHTVICDAPAGRAVDEKPKSFARVVGYPRLGGLHHRYEWQAAA